MSEAEAIEQLRALDDLHDTEVEHSRADDILCEFLRTNGFAALAEQFVKQSQHYWYA